MYGHLGPLQLQEIRFEGGIVPNTFQGLDFIITIVDIILSYMPVKQIFNEKHNLSNSFEFL